MKTAKTQAKNPRSTAEATVVHSVIADPFNDQDRAYSEVLHNAYLKMATEIKDGRDDLFATIEDDETYQGADVLKLVDQVIDGVVSVVEVNMVKPPAHKGLSDIYFDMINT